MGNESSSTKETHYTEADIERVRREAEAKREAEESRMKRRLENERRTREAEERLQRLQGAIAEEEARMRAEEQKRLQVEAELYRRRDQLLNYKFGTKTGLRNFVDLQIEDVTHLRIGLLGPSGSGKSMFINTCERTVRQTEKGTVLEVTTGEDATVILQDYLPEMFFRLVDTRGFVRFNAYEVAELRNILTGKIQSGGELFRPYDWDGQVSAAQEMYQKPELSQRLHGVIFVVKANDPRLLDGALTDYLEPIRDVVREIGIAPVTVITHRDTLEDEQLYEDALSEALAATGSYLRDTFSISNYTINNTERNSEIEKMALDILDCALMNAERAVQIMMKKEEKNKQEGYRWKATREDLRTQLREMEQQLTSLHGQFREQEGETANLQEQVNTLERQLSVKDQRLNELEMTLSTAQQALEHQRQQVTPDWVISRDQIQSTDTILGTGGWGSVVEGKYCGCSVAVKQIHELILSPHNRTLFQREMDIASRCRHPCLLQFIGATNDEGSPLFVTELMESSLRKLLERRPLGATEVSIISFDVARALNYLHQKKPSPIIHRDISSANVLLWRQGAQWRGKVSDYGTADLCNIP